MSGQTIWSNRAAVIDCAHGHVAAVSWQFDRVVLNDILLDNGVATRTLQLGLLERLVVEVALRNVAIVARNVRSNLGRANGQFMSLIGHLSSVVRQLVSRVCAKFAKALMILCVEEGALTDVCFAGKTP